MKFSEIDLTYLFFHIFNPANLHKLVGSHNNLSAFNALKISGSLLFIVFLFMGSPSLAQEKQDFPNEENYRPGDGGSHLDGQSINKEKEAVRDTLMAKPATTAASRPKSEGATNPKKAQEETLSFNVLYFIIQKFKVSDMIN
jgi:hypothetical protein